MSVIPLLDLPILCLVTDRLRCSGRPLEDVVARAVEGGVGMVQLRERDLSADALFELAKRIREITRDHALLFVNDRVDVVLAVGADGVQLPESGLPVEAVRTLAGDRLLVGRSVHDVEGAVAAEADGADLLIAGSVFATASHPGHEPEGIELLHRLSGSVGVPYLGVGGVTAENVGVVMEAGASGVAVITAVTESDDPRLTAHDMAGQISRTWAAAKTTVH
ncbi:MAG: thiamine phosphate synthase [SAR202 cluster bacterium]|nr:thiamine phosphate synthase [SAR202 cluster bacterium]